MRRRSLFNLLAAATACAAMEVCGLKPLVRAEVVTFDAGNWTGEMHWVNYQWFRDGQPIMGANGSLYEITSSDVGRDIMVTIGESS